MKQPKAQAQQDALAFLEAMNRLKPNQAEAACLVMKGISDLISTLPTHVIVAMRPHIVVFLDHCSQSHAKAN